MKEIIAMHGWGGDSYKWVSWANLFQQEEWLWQSAERGYGKLKPFMPSWKEAKKSSCNQRVLICHSLGLHLIDKKILQEATTLVLLASFGRFIPSGKENRRLETALRGMQNAIGTSQEREMLLTFYEEARKPESMTSALKSDLKKELSASGRIKLKEDLHLLIHTTSIPRDIPQNADVLIINSHNDHIINQSSKKAFVQELINHLQLLPTVWNLTNLGHTLDSERLIKEVKDWIE